MDIIYNNEVPSTQSEEMNRDRVEVIVDIYNSEDYVRDQDLRTYTNTQQPVQFKGSDSIRVYRAVMVCLGLLCMLLTAVIVLFVLMNANNHQCHNQNLTEERNQPLTEDSKITEERDQQLTNDTNLKEEIDELIYREKNITHNRDQLKQKMYNLLMYLGKLDRWTYFKFRFYYISTERKSWTESRNYCRERGADLIIINNKEEDEFIKKMSCGASFWIGLSDSDEEGTWKWVNNSTLNYRLWGSNEPNGKTTENCAASYLSGWYDYPCTTHFNWICEKRTLIDFIDLFEHR